jgi:hypothetical protein
MIKVGRNDPRRCGSGKKYKRCCLAADEEEARRAESAAGEDDDCLCDECLSLDEVAEFSDRASVLMSAGRLDEAEVVCRELIREYPHFLDGAERLGAVYEARGEGKAAADQYRRAAEIAAAMPAVLVDEDTRASLLVRAQRLEAGSPRR